MSMARCMSSAVVCLLLVACVCANYDPFDEDLVYNQLMYSYAAYCPTNTSWSCSWCTYPAPWNISDFQLTSVIYNDTRDVQAFVGIHGNTLQIAYRGTVDITNWIYNLNFKHVAAFPRFPGAIVHGGFLDDWYSIKSELVEAVTDLLYNRTFDNILITGHSLGAALAELSAVDMISQGIINQSVTIYNYGAPRVGNSVWVEYASQLISNLWRSVNDRDVVPHLPIIDFGFLHAPTEVWWHNETYQVCNETNGEDPDCSDSLYFPVSISDHLHYLNFYLDLSC